MFELPGQRRVRFFNTCPPSSPLFVSFVVVVLMPLFLCCLLCSSFFCSSLSVFLVFHLVCLSLLTKDVSGFSTPPSLPLSSIPLPNQKRGGGREVLRILTRPWSEDSSTPSEMQGKPTGRNKRRTNKAGSKGKGSTAQQRRTNQTGGKRGGKC